MITTFKTHLYLKNTVSAAQVWETVKSWRLASKNSHKDIKKQLKDYTVKNVAGNVVETKMFTAENSSSIEIKHFFDSNAEYWAFHLMEPQAYSGNEWNTYIVYSREADKCVLTFETTFDGNIPKHIPRNKPAYFERNLDDLIDYKVSRISKSAVRVDEAMVPVLAEDMMNSVPMTKPIVYISYPHSTVDTEALAKKLYCMATVYVERDDHVSFSMQEHTGGEIVYGGVIGIYYGNKRSFRVFPDKNKNIDYIYRKIAEITAVKRLPDGYTWFDILQIESVQKQKKLAAGYKQLSAESKKTIDELLAVKQNKEQAIQNLTDQIAGQDKLIENLKEQIGEKNNHIANLEKKLKDTEHERDKFIENFDMNEKELPRLREENEFYKQQFSEKQQNESGVALFIPCSEKNLFPNEIEDFLKAVFFKAIQMQKTQNMHKGSRKEHVIESIDIQDWAFECSKTADRYKSYEDELKKNCRNNDDLIAVLKGHDFFDKTEKGHHKMYFFGDERYGITVSKTASDCHSNMNTVKDAGKSCFLKP